MRERSSLIGKKGNQHPSFGIKWYNNGKEDKRSFEHPGVGWIEGRVFKERKKRK